jgi:predicted Zn-dependent protease
MISLSALLLPAVLGFGLGDITEIVESEDVQSALDVADAFAQAGRGISDSEEYYLGRAVAANVFAAYSPTGDAAFTDYLNSVGSWVAMCSPLPATYGGWHFEALGSTQINAMACPGGLIFVTTGLLSYVEDEDELACVLAHEVAHVALHHGIGSVQQSRWIQAFSLAGMTGAERWGSDELREAAESYGDVVTDISESIITKGYSRESEEQADSLAMVIAAAAGYDPSALGRVIQRMAAVTARSGPGFWQTHPSPEDRLEKVSETAGGQTPGYEARKVRFEAALAGMTSPFAGASSGSTTPSTVGRGSSGSGSSGGGRTSGSGR